MHHQDIIQVDVRAKFSGEDFSMKGIEYDFSSSKFKLPIDKKIYDLEAVMKAAYLFIDNFYIIFREKKDNLIEAEFTSKNNLSDIDLKKKTGEFYNELLHQVLRNKIADQTQNLRELVIGRALYNTCINTADEENIEKNGYFPNKSYEDNSYRDDQLEIAKSWFDKEDVNIE